MSIHELFSFALQYLKLGTAVGILFLLGQLFIKKFVTHTTVSWRTLFWNFIFIVYVIVLLCATLARSGYERVVKLQPFSSYIAAWNHTSASEWRNLFINILLFIPLGFLLPLLSDKWKKCWKTYICGAIIALFIECLQFVFYRGIVEFDDFLNNTLGTAIGYGFNQILCSIIDAARKRKSIRGIWLALYQIPFAAVITAYAVFFISYSQLQLGTLSCRYSELINMSGITVESQCEISSNESEDCVYIGTLLSEEDSEAFAEDYFQSLGGELDQTQNDIYENIAMYKSKSMQYILSVTYRGGGYELTDFGSEAEDESYFTARTNGLSVEKIRGLLQPYHIAIPNKAAFTELGNGEYQYAIHMTKEGDYWYDGISRNHKSEQRQHHPHKNPGSKIMP